MEHLNISGILGRLSQEEALTGCLEEFEKNKKNMLTKRGVYVYGAPGSGKTFFVKDVNNLTPDLFKFCDCNYNH